MPGRPCTPEAGAANDLDSAHVAGHGHGFRLGVDQPDYLRVLRCFASMLGRVALHPSVTRRAASYESHPSWVSIQPRSRTAEADPGPCRELPGAGPTARFGSGASPRMQWKTVRRCPSGMCRPARRTGASASPCLDADGPPAGKSTGRKFPTVPERSRSCHAVSTPAIAAATGAEKRPRNVSGPALLVRPWLHYAGRNAMSPRRPGSLSCSAKILKSPYLPSHSLRHGPLRRHRRSLLRPLAKLAIGCLDGEARPIIRPHLTTNHRSHQIRPPAL